MKRLTNNRQRWIQAVRGGEPLAVNEAKNAIIRLIENCDNGEIQKIFSELTEDTQRQIMEHAESN